MPITPKPCRAGGRGMAGDRDQDQARSRQPERGFRPAQPHRQDQSQQQPPCGPGKIWPNERSRLPPATRSGVRGSGRRPASRPRPGHPEQRRSSATRRPDGGPGSEACLRKRQFGDLGGQQREQAGTAKQCHHARLMQAAHENRGTTSRPDAEMQTALLTPFRHGRPNASSRCNRRAPGCPGVR